MPGNRRQDAAHSFFGANLYAKNLFAVSGDVIPVYICHETLRVRHYEGSALVHKIHEFINNCRAFIPAERYVKKFEIIQILCFSLYLPVADKFEPGASQGSCHKTFGEDERSLFMAGRTQAALT
ncbi:MAG: hypothetical protein HY360_21325 [Verrucomicrobia bacterium]|nr:hypothetical protein [Verrucomicrobiota bacterium]